MDTSTLSSKGQFTIPASLRKSLQLETGDKLNCFVDEDKLIIIPAKSSVKKLKGMFGEARRKATLEDIDQAIAQEASKSLCS